MSQVNPDVTEAVETTSYIVHSAVEIWTVIPMEIKVFLIMLAGTSLLMEFTKKTVLSGLSKKKRISWLWVAGMAIGNVMAYTGNYLLGDLVAPWYWIFLAVCISTVAMGVHWLSIHLVIPIGSMIYEELLDRIYLMTFKKPRVKKNAK